MSDKKSYFLERKNELKTEIAALDRMYNVLSAVRAVVFLVAAVGIIIGLKDRQHVLLAAGICLIIVFVILVRRHGKLAEKQEYKNAEFAVVERYVSRYDDSWREFADDGGAFIEKEDTVSVDVDLLGRASLYQLINVAHTDGGRKRLADALKTLAPVSADELTARNESATELSENTEFAISFETLSEEVVDLCKRKKNTDIKKFTDFCEDEAKGGIPGWINCVRIIFPIAFWVLLVLGISGALSLGPAVIMFFVMLIFSWLTKGITDSVIAPFYFVSFAVRDYKRMMELVSATEFKTDRLKEIQKLYDGKAGVLSAFSRLEAICQSYNVVFNPLVHMLLSGVLMWDYQLAFSMSSWKKKYGHNIQAAFEGIYELEFLLSLSVMPNIRETTLARVDTEQDKKVHFEAKGLYHPLISADKVVANDAKLTSGITVVTGSNMSGKTTFLRTVAINLALAYIGGPVCAKELSTGYMKLFTSMRLTDDVANGISTFYAEILRIKTMVEFRNTSDLPMICMIDEIFKGTNSADRIIGAREAITRLSGGNSMVLVSTHDFELCTLEDSAGNPAVNYHFEEYYEDDRLMFDYRMRDGRCTTTNAKAILKMAGIFVENY